MVVFCVVWFRLRLLAAGPIFAKFTLLFSDNIMSLQPASELPRNKKEKVHPLLLLLVPLRKACAKTHSCGNQMEFADERQQSRLLSAGEVIRPTSLIAVYCSTAEAHMTWFRDETQFTIR